MIRVYRLKKKFGRSIILDGLDFEARRGQITLLTGANGTGKSTALRILAGVLPENSGEVRLDGVHVPAPKRRRNIAFLPQGIAFQPRLNPRRLMRFYARALGTETARIQPALIRWGLEEHTRKPSATLSGGLRQRLGLSVLELRDAPALLLDEPGLSLDPYWRVQMQDCLREKARQGRTVLVATHLLAEWENRADRCLVIEEGRICDELDPTRLTAPNRLTRPHRHVC